MSMFRFSRKAGSAEEFKFKQPQRVARISLERLGLGALASRNA